MYAPRNITCCRYAVIGWQYVRIGSVCLFLGVEDIAGERFKGNTEDSIMQACCFQCEYA